MMSISTYVIPRAWQVMSKLAGGGTVYTIGTSRWK